MKLLNYLKSLFNTKAKIKKVYYDLETTGLDKNECAIVELSLIMEIDGKVVDTFTSKVKPHEWAKLEHPALKIIGSSEEELSKLPSNKEVHEKMLEFLSKYINRYDRDDKAYLIGYNNRRFDDDFFRAWFNRLEDKFYGAWFHKMTIDVSVLVVDYVSKNDLKVPDFKLANIAEYLGNNVEPSKLHRAEYDTELTRYVHHRINSRFKIGKWTIF